MKLICSDGETVELEDKLAIRSITLRNCVADTDSSAQPDDDEEIPINFESSSVAKIAEYIKLHNETPGRWADNYSAILSNEDRGMFAMTAVELIPIYEAAMFLAIPSLIHVMKKLLAEQIDEIAKQPASIANKQLTELLGLPDDAPSEDEMKALYAAYSWLEHVCEN